MIGQNVVAVKLVSRVLTSGMIPSLQVYTNRYYAF
jgi:hypothetical protein